MIKIIEDDYMDYLYEYFNTGYYRDDLIYPFKNNPGFNMSIGKFYNNKYLVSIRIVIPFSALLYKKDIKPGIPAKDPKIKYEHKVFKELFTDNNYSDVTVWDWNNSYQSTIFFVCDLNIDTLILKVDRRIEPVAVYQAKYSFPIPKNMSKGLFNTQHFFYQDDFRIFFANNICYLYDAYINQIQVMKLINNKLVLEVKYDHICNRRYTNNNIIEEGDYKKTYEKNWSLYSIIKEGKEEKVFKFIHDFEENGVYGVNYYPQNQKCEKILLVPFKKNSIPVNHNSNYCRFSIGSTMLDLGDNKYLGVGHTKIRFKKQPQQDLKTSNNKELMNKINEFDNYFHEKAKKMHLQFKKKFKEYKPHRMYIYGFYFFIYNENDKTFKISDIFLPLPDYKYKFLLTFPMSVIRVKNDILISAGYGDYTNLLIKMPEKDIMNYIRYDIQNMDVKDLQYIFVK